MHKKTDDTAIRITTNDIRAVKTLAEPLVCLTAYTARIAQILDAHCDLLLVGDTMGMVLYGMDNTRGVTLDMMINHGKAVMRGSEKACVIVDMPFGTYENSPEQALASARRIMEETGCGGVKLEGGAAFAPTIKTLVSQGIPVVAHIGLLPQSVEDASGFKVQGKSDDDQQQLLEDAKAVEEAGAFAIVIEATIDSVAALITRTVSVPTIGIGASPECDGQILVTEDMLGITGDHVPKFVKHYAQISEDIEKAVALYAQEVRTRAFPDIKNLYTQPAARLKEKAS
ncbi:MAG: 3-methyl-2-oxobutanoate hydroxymethyltransferase [Alphaproteobacteria bacterium]